MRRMRAFLPSLAVCFLASCTPGSATAPGTITQVKDATSHAEARTLAQTQDIPAIKQSDRMVITTHEGGDGKTVEVTNAAALNAIRAGLTITKANPSGGIVAFTVTFYRGTEKLRTVWVYDYGEWGVQRTGTSWTCGRSDTLVKAIMEALAKP